MSKHIVSLEFKVIDARVNTEVAQVEFTAPGDPDIAVPAAYGYYKSKIDGAVHVFMLDAGGRLYDYKHDNALCAI